MKIQFAEANDVPEICDLLEKITPNVNRLVAIKKFLQIVKNNDYILLVAKTEIALNHNFMSRSVVIGTAMMHMQHKLSYNGIGAHLEDVVVAEPYRRKGIGSQLVQNMIDIAKAQHCYKVMLTCSEKNIAYYERFGFQKNNIEMRLSLS